MNKNVEYAWDGILLTQENKQMMQCQTLVVEKSLVSPPVKKKTH